MREGAAAHRVLILGPGDAARKIERRLRHATSSSTEITSVAAVSDALDHLRRTGAELALVHLSAARDGGDVVAALHDVDPDLPVIALGRRAEEQRLRRITRDGAAEFLLDEELDGDGAARTLGGALERCRLRRIIQEQEAALAVAEARFHAIIERTADGIVIVDGNGITRFVNAAAEALFGRAAAEVLGHDFGFPIVAGATTEIDLVRRGGGTTVAELRVVETTWEGQSAALVSLRDITDRRHAEERARRLATERAARAAAEAAERRARFLSEASSALANSLDYDATLGTLVRLGVPFLGDWCVIDVLEGGGLRRVASAHVDAAGESVLQKLESAPRLGADDNDTPVAQAIRTGEPVLIPEVSTEWLLGLAKTDAQRDALERLAPGSLLVVPLVARERLLGALTLATGGSRRLGQADLELARELARRAALSVDNARLYREAQAANQAKADFLAVMSHELRTPLNAILGYGDLMLMGIPDTLPSPLKRHVERIGLAANHLLQVIDEILSFARMEAGREEVRFQPVPLARVLEAVVAVIEPLAMDKALDFEVRLPDRGVEIETDTSKLRQILLNLLSNAVKFTGAGRVSLHARVKGDHLEMEVADTGIGIPAEHHQRVFEPFWQVEHAATRRAGGTGLGLTVCRRLSRLLGGELTLESREGAGSMFLLRLPLRSSRHADTAAEAAPDPAPGFRSRSDRPWPLRAAARPPVATQAPEEPPAPA